MNVRRVRESDLPRLLRFLAVQFPGTYKGEERYFRWRFCESPLGSSVEGYWIAEHEGQIVGQLGALRDRLFVAGGWIDCWWLVDLIVAPEFRGGLTALRLFQAAMQQGLLLTTGAGPHLQELYRTLGWLQLQVAESYYLPLRPSRLLRMAKSSGRGSWRIQALMPLALAADLVSRRLCRRRMRLAAEEPDTVVRQIEKFDSQADALFERAAESSGITTYRRADQFDWKFNRRPLGRHLALAAAESHKPDELCGLLVAKVMQRRGVASWLEIVDYVVCENDAGMFLRLLSEAIQRTAEIDFVRCRFSNPQHQAALSKRGWLRRTLPVADALFVWSDDAALKTRLEVGPWHLTSLVSDRADYGRDDWGGGPSADRENTAHESL